MFFSRTLFLALLASSTVVTSNTHVPVEQIRGLAPARREHYRNAQQPFKCITHPSIMGSLNDDRCDCPDGSDEPGTSACAHLFDGLLHDKPAQPGDPYKMVFSDGFENQAYENEYKYLMFGFYCPAEHRLIPYWKVDDTICDCCDGSDELLECPNTCAQVVTKDPKLGGRIILGDPALMSGEIAKAKQAGEEARRRSFAKFTEWSDFAASYLAKKAELEKKGSKSPGLLSQKSSEGGASPLPDYATCEDGYAPCGNARAPERELSADDGLRASEYEKTEEKRRIFSQHPELSALDGVNVYFKSGEKKTWGPLTGSISRADTWVYYGDSLGSFQSFVDAEQMRKLRDIPLPGIHQNVRSSLGLLYEQDEDCPGRDHKKGLMLYTACHVGADELVALDQYEGCYSSGMLLTELVCAD